MNDEVTGALELGLDVIKENVQPVRKQQESNKTHAEKVLASKRTKQRKHRQRMKKRASRG